MEVVVSTLSLKLYLIICCLFAPLDQTAFEIELREGQQTTGIVLYVHRTEQGFSIHETKERTGPAMMIRKVDDRYVLLNEKDGKESEFWIDNSKVDIKPLEEQGTYSRTIKEKEVHFEFDGKTRKIYQEKEDKIFFVR